MNHDKVRCNCPPCVAVRLMRFGLNLYNQRAFLIALPYPALVEKRCAELQASSIAHRGQA